MRVLSIDVGIRNLGICIIDASSGMIIDWQVIDLCDKQPTCSYMGRRRVCAKPARFTHNGIFICRAHASVNGRCLRKDVPSINNLKAKTSEDLIQVARDCGVNYDGLTQHKLAKSIRAHMLESCPSPINVPDASTIELTELARIVQNKLDNNLSLGNIDEIIIENQISPIAGRMKCLQAMLTQYFVMRAQCPVRFVSASMKLRNIEGQKATYAQRKKLGITSALKYLEYTDSAYINMFKTHRKQDDLADSLLQGLAYMNDAGHISCKIDNADYLK